MHLHQVIQILELFTLFINSLIPEILFEVCLCFIVVVVSVMFMYYSEIFLKFIFVHTVDSLSYVTYETSSSSLPGGAEEVVGVPHSPQTHKTNYLYSHLHIVRLY